MRLNNTVLRVGMRLNNTVLRVPGGLGGAGGVPGGLGGAGGVPGGYITVLRVLGGYITVLRVLGRSVPRRGVPREAIYHQEEQEGGPIYHQEEQEGTYPPGYTSRGTPLLPGTARPRLLSSFLARGFVKVSSVLGAEHPRCSTPAPSSIPSPVDLREERRLREVSLPGLRSST